MSVVKKIISQGIESVKETVKEGAGEIAKTVSPEKVVEQITGTSAPKKDELTQYLQNLDPNLTPEKISQLNKQEEQGLSSARATLEQAKKPRTAIPLHMRPSPKPREPRPWEIATQEEERKKALKVEAQKKQQTQQPIISTSKQPRGVWRIVGKRPKTSDFERGKNIKIG